MPELPEVETIRRQLEPQLVGRTIVDASAFESDKFLPALLATGSRIDDVRRRGKYLLLPIRDERSESAGGGSELIVHLGMTGRLWVGPTTDAPEGAGHLRARWDLDDGRTLFFDDVRRFGRIAVLPAGDHASLPTLDALGPEPFDEAFNPEQLRAAVNGSTRAIKTQLLSQRVVAGVGNIYADEALFRARVHPQQPANSLGKAAVDRLREAIAWALDMGIAQGGAKIIHQRAYPVDDFPAVHGREGESCVGCGGSVKKITIAARGTYFCPSCQRLRQPKPKTPTV